MTKILIVEDHALVREAMAQRLACLEPELVCLESAGADEALALGLVNRVVEREALEAEAMALAEKLAAKSPIAVQTAKRGFYGSEDMDYYRQFDLMNEAFARLCTTSDAKEGVKAFFEKRPPVWAER